MLALLIVLQVIVAIFLILVVLLQPGNRGGMSAALGGASGETVFGARGANTFLSKLTFGAAALFMVTSVTLSFMSMPPKSVVDQALQKANAVAPTDKPADVKDEPGKPADSAAVAPSNEEPKADTNAPAPAVPAPTAGTPAAAPTANPDQAPAPKAPEKK